MTDSDSVPTEIEGDFLDLLIERLEKYELKEKLKPEIAPLLIAPPPKLSSGLSELCYDLKSLLGIDADRYDYRFSDIEYSFWEAHQIILSNLRQLSKNENFVPKRLYVALRKSIVFKEQTIKVEELVRSDWNYSLYKASKSNAYYVDLVFIKSFVESNKLIAIDDSLYRDIELALLVNDIAQINTIVESIREKHQDEE